MALVEYKLKSILLISLDPVPDDETTNDKAISTSCAKPDVTDADRWQLSEFLDRFLLSDSNNKAIRVPIIIDDSVIPAHHTGSSVVTRKNVDYDAESDPVVVLDSNNVAISIDLHNNITRLSTAADIFTGITDGVFKLFTTSPRVSFFGSSVSIFNGYLTGVFRRTTHDSDREVLNLSIEKAEENPQPTVKHEATNINKAIDSAPTETVPQPDLSQPAGLLASTNEQKKNTDGRVFNWFAIATLDRIEEQNVPEIFSNATVNRLDYTIFNVTTLDFEGVERSAITVTYDDVNIPVNLSDNNPYYNDGYAVETDENGVLYLGVEAVA